MTTINGEKVNSKYLSRHWIVGVPVVAVFGAAFYVGQISGQVDQNTRQSTANHIELNDLKDITADLVTIGSIQEERMTLLQAYLADLYRSTDAVKDFEIRDNLIEEIARRVAAVERSILSRGP